jgi:hypothetical protein
MARPDRSIVWNHVVRHFGDAWELSVDDLEKSLRAEKHDVDRGFVIAFFKELVGRKLGSFYTGRRGRPTRLSWNKKPKEVNPDLVLMNGARPADPQILEHPFPLRPGVTARLFLPQDLTAADAARLIDFVKLLTVA